MCVRFVVVVAQRRVWPGRADKEGKEEKKRRDPTRGPPSLPSPANEADEVWRLTRVTLSLVARARVLGLTARDAIRTAALLPPDQSFEAGLHKVFTDTL